MLVDNTKIMRRGRCQCVSTFLRRKGCHSVAAGMDAIMQPLRQTLAYANACCGVALNVVGVYAGKGITVTPVSGLFPPGTGPAPVDVPSPSIDTGPVDIPTTSIGGSDGGGFSAPRTSVSSVPDEGERLRYHRDGGGGGGDPAGRRPPAPAVSAAAAAVAACEATAQQQSRASVASSSPATMRHSDFYHQQYHQYQHQRQQQQHLGGTGPAARGGGGPAAWSTSAARPNGGGGEPGGCGGRTPRGFAAGEGAANNNQDGGGGDGSMHTTLYDVPFPATAPAEAKFSRSASMASVASIGLEGDTALSHHALSFDLDGAGPDGFFHLGSKTDLAMAATAATVAQQQQGGGGGKDGSTV